MKTGPVDIRLTPEQLARFQSQIDKRGPDECWPWTGPKHEKGYGSFHIYVSRFLRRRVPTHRLALMLRDGVTRMPTEIFACHHCDNPPCCNPEHLYWGTTTDNQRDARAKGGHPGWESQDQAGEHNGNAFGDLFRPCKQCQKRSKCSEL